MDMINKVALKTIMIESSDCFCFSAAFKASLVKKVHMRHVLV